MLWRRPRDGRGAEMRHRDVRDAEMMWTLDEELGSRAPVNALRSLRYLSGFHPPLPQSPASVVHPCAIIPILPPPPLLLQVPASVTLPCAIVPIVSHPARTSTSSAFHPSSASAPDSTTSSTTSSTLPTREEPSHVSTMPLRTPPSSVSMPLRARRLIVLLLRRIVSQYPYRFG